MAVIAILLIIVGVSGLVRFGLPLAISLAGEFSFLFIKKTDSSTKHRANNRRFLKRMAVKTAIAIAALMVGWFLLNMGS